MELLLGCGRSRVKKLAVQGREEWRDLVTVDMNEHVGADVVHNLNNALGLPFSADSADEIHAYDVFEHLGTQGDWRFFFTEFSDYWHIAKPGGTLHAIVPWWQSCWAWGDPGHTRVIQPEMLTFLDQSVYVTECDTPETRTNRTDYRPWYRADWQTIWQQRDGDNFCFVLRAVKPSRCAL